MKTTRRSRQREELKKYLASRKDHPTAEMIYAALRKEDPTLSLGTVYRNLALLTKLGEIREIGTENGPDHYDADTSIHGHLICRHCLQVYDLQITGLEHLMKQAEDISDGRIEDLSANFYGTCVQCLKNAEDLSKQDA